MTNIDLALDMVAESDKASIFIKLESQRPSDTIRSLSFKYSEKEKKPFVHKEEDNSNNNNTTTTTTIMTAKKIYSLEKPDDRARELAARLSLEEQVSCLFSPWSLLSSAQSHL
jgi:hypothetical protein